MIRIIDDRKTISKLQKQFEKHLRGLLDQRFSGKVSHRPSFTSVEIWYSNSHDFWYASINNQMNRYFNVFGLGKPDTGFTHKIINEICIPKVGINRRIAGAFGKDEHGNFYILHRGIIGGGVKGIGKNLFMRKYCENFDQIQDGERISKMVVIANIHSDKLDKRITDFIKEVNRIKTDLHNSIKNNEITH